MSKGEWSGCKTRAHVWFLAKAAQDTNLNGATSICKHLKVKRDNKICTKS